MRKIESGKDPGPGDEILGRMEPLGGVFPAMLRDGLSGAAGDPDALAEVIRNAAKYPGAWLATEYFGWSAE